VRQVDPGHVTLHPSWWRPAFAGQGYRRCRASAIEGKPACFTNGAVAQGGRFSGRCLDHKDIEDIKLNRPRLLPGILAAARY
jgi:hypothetical protein